ncbi:MAG TPA: hypothetical protein VGR03_05915 [Candidatus Acidoferrum sp.]|nr:hypothetical protein [Candidatus Acidoferrum sp.]
MNRKVTMLSAIAVCLGAAAAAQAQQAMLTPPKVLVIGREVVKPGKGAAHEKWEAGWPRAYARAKWPVNYLALTAMTGEGRALYITGYDSMAAWESDIQAQGKNAAFTAETEALAEKDGEFLSENRTAVFTYMPELSYQPDVPVAGTRGFTIASFVLKPGHADQFTEARKAARVAHDKAGLTDHFAVYHLTAGGNTNTYLIFLPFKSLAEQDQFAAMHGKAYQDALGEDGQKKLADLNSQAVESAETQLFAFSPKMSYVSKDWIAADPKFWAPKPAAAAPAPPSGAAEKPAAKPAAKKEAPKKP